MCPCRSRVCGAARRPTPRGLLRQPALYYSDPRDPSCACADQEPARRRGGRPHGRPYLRQAGGHPAGGQLRAAGRRGGAAAGGRQPLPGRGRGVGLRVGGQLLRGALRQQRQVYFPTGLLRQCDSPEARTWPRREVSLSRVKKIPKAPVLSCSLPHAAAGLYLWIKFASSRCDCPCHKTINAPWPGTPALPAGQFAADYGVRLAGQFLVSRPADGVVGETPAIFPNASDYHLLCLQARHPMCGGVCHAICAYIPVMLPCVAAHLVTARALGACTCPVAWDALR